MRYYVATAPLLLSGMLSAQYVSPSFHAIAGAPSSNSFPFGVSTVPMRYLQVHDDVPAMPITGIANRLGATTANAFGFSVTCDMWLSTALTTSTTANATFDLNHGPNKTQVVTAGVFNIPPSNSRFVPQPFVRKYPCSLFVFPGGGSLCWEVQVTARTNAFSTFDDAIGATSTNPALQVGVGGRGCFATGYNLPVTASGSSTMSWTTNSGTLTVSGGNLPLLTPAYHTIGTDPNNWSSLSLPFTLPGTGSAPSGPCNIYNDVVTAISLTTTATGTVTSAVPIPAFPSFNGLTIHSQIWAVDLAANSWGIVTSPGVAHNFLAPYPAPPLVRVYLSGALTATGTVGANTGLVTRFF